MIMQWREEEFDVIWGGDQNVAAGRLLIPGNDVVLSPAGKLFNEIVVYLEMEIANNLSSDPVTHVDLKTKTRRALDLVVVNRLEKIKNFVIDSERNFSPFTPKFINGKVERCYSDHYSIVFDYESGEEIKNDSHVQNKKKIWQYNTKDGNEKFEILINNLFDWLIQIIEEVDDSESVINCLALFGLS